jgi:hypothetical protein
VERKDLNSYEQGIKQSIEKGESQAIARLAIQFLLLLVSLFALSPAAKPSTGKSPRRLFSRRLAPKNCISQICSQIVTLHRQIRYSKLLEK